MPDAVRPRLLFYCQHSLGIGHLTRSFALAAALADLFHVVFLNGGRLPPGLRVPPRVDLIDLPPLGMDDDHTVISRDATQGVAAAQARRRALIDAALERHRPSIVLIELFPFGRKKFAGEIVPLIRRARLQTGGPALVVCSLRDILVDARPDQQEHDDRARWWADRYFDAVLVHADPKLARLEESFHPRHPLRVPVHYTGYVVPDRSAPAPCLKREHVLVSAGGGIVGAPLFQAALQARALRRDPLPMRVITGPFLPEPQWCALQRSVRGVAGVELVRHVPDMVSEMRAARASISQCGYNTALDILVAGVPALVVPYGTATENEQRERAARLASLGVLRQMSNEALDASSLAAQIEALLAFKPVAAALDLHGAANSAQRLHRLYAQSASAASNRGLRCRSA